MLFSHFKFAWRHIRKNISYSLINITGLALGIASVLLIFLYAQHELSYDQYNEKKDRIYRIVDYSGYFEQWSGSVEGNLVPVMRKNFPEVEDAVSIASDCGGDFIIDDKNIEGIDPKCSESNMFNIFSFTLLSGNPETVLDKPHSVVLTQSLAERLFPKENPIGQSIEIQGDEIPGTFTVRGIMQDIPENSHFTANLFVSFRALDNDRRNQAHYRYVLLTEGSNPERVADRAFNHMKNVLGKGKETEDLKLQPLTDI